MVSPVIAKIISVQQSFTVIENEIAQYVMNNAEKVVSSTITTMSKEYHSFQKLSIFLKIIFIQNDSF